MKVVESEDRFGKSCLIFPRSATVPEIHEWLNLNYHDYQFAIVLDETKDEYEPYNETVVNFFGDLADEAIVANGGMHAVSDWEMRKINKYLREHGTDWEAVMLG